MSKSENGLQEQLLERNRDLLNQLQQKDSEINQFHELIHIMRQDLEVKEKNQYTGYEGGPGCMRQGEGVPSQI